MKAKSIDAIVITASYKLDGISVLETNCTSFQQFCDLPQVVEYEGKIFGKSGWSSDRCYACYKSNISVAFGVK